MNSVPLFLIATPRSGSTLLTRILKRGDSVAFWGETNRLLFKIRDLHKFRQTFISNHPNSIMPIEVQAAKGHFPAHCIPTYATGWDLGIRNLMAGWAGASDTTQFWGWKEVHLCRYEDGGDLLDWLLNLLPDAKLIILRRDTGDVVRSMCKKPEWWSDTYGRGEQLIKMVEGQHRRLGEFAETRADRCWSIQYEDVIGSGFPGKLMLNTGVRVADEAYRDEVGKIIK